MPTIERPWSCEREPWQHPRSHELNWCVVYASLLVDRSLRVFVGLGTVEDMQHTQRPESWQEECECQRSQTPPHRQPLAAPRTKEEEESHAMLKAKMPRGCVLKGEVEPNILTGNQMYRQVMMTCGPPGCMWMYGLGFRAWASRSVYAVVIALLEDP